MVDDGAGRLPRGFHDWVGDEAALQQHLRMTFATVAQNHGFEAAVCSPVGFAAPFRAFGSAALGRMFEFEDLAGRSLALNADSLLPHARAVISTRRIHGPKPVRIAGEVAVARYRRKPFRGFSHLTFTSFGERDRITRDAVLIRAMDDLFRTLGVTSRVELHDLRLLDDAGQLGSQDSLRESLHRSRAGGEVEPALGGRLSSWRTIRDELRGVPHSFGTGLARFVAAHPHSAAAAEYVTRLCEILVASGLDVRLGDVPSGVEYIDDTSAVFRSGPEKIAVVGSHSAAVARLRPGLGNVGSAALALEATASLLRRNEVVPNQLRRATVVQAGAGDAFFSAATRALRSNGWAVAEHWGDNQRTSAAADRARRHGHTVCEVKVEDERSASVALHDRDLTHGPYRVDSVPSCWQDGSDQTARKDEHE